MGNPLPAAWAGPPQTASLAFRVPLQSTRYTATEVSRPQGKVQASAHSNPSCLDLRAPGNLARQAARPLWAILALSDCPLFSRKDLPITAPSRAT